MKRILVAVMMIVTVILVAGLVASCSHKPPEPKEAVIGEFEGAPPWVVKGCAAYIAGKDAKDKANPVVCGVGTMGSTRNAGLARETAIARGRTEIARSLQVQVQSMLKDYQASTTGGQNYGTAASDEQHVVDVSKQITDMSLSGTEMVDSWISKNGNFYALVVLDVARFKDAVSKMSNLSDAVRAAVQQRADKAFDDLDKEIAKKNGQ